MLQDYQGEPRPGAAEFDSQEQRAALSLGRQLGWNWDPAFLGHLAVPAHDQTAPQAHEFHSRLIGDDCEHQSRESPAIATERLSVEPGREPGSAGFQSRPAPVFPQLPSPKADFNTAFQNT